MDAESRRMSPGQQFGDQLISNYIPLPEYRRSKQPGQRLQRSSRHYMKNTPTSKEPVGYNPMQMGVPPGIVTERLDHQHDTGDTIRQAQRYTEKFAERTNGTACSGICGHSGKIDGA